MHELLREEEFQREVAKRMSPPLNMSRVQAEMLVSHTMWSPPVNASNMTAEIVEYPIDRAKVNKAFDAFSEKLVKQPWE